ncbi:MAG: hypothetical protein HKN17_03040 [Rhodothermales bacterium]|nr:hypothetical protein [Rhodothermales bacterium]
MLLASAATGCDSESLVSSDSDHLNTALSLLGSDGVVLGYADFEAIERHADLWYETVTGEAPERDAISDEFESRTGVDVENDVRAMFGTIHGGIESEQGSAIVFGTWDSDEVIDHLDLHTGISRVEHSGPDDFTAYGVTDMRAGDGTLFLAVSPDGFILMSSSESRFESMMQRASSMEPPTGGGPLLDDLAPYDAWMVVNDVRSMLPDVMPRDGQFGMVGPLLETVAAAGFGADLTDESAEALLLLQPRDDVRAEDLANIIRGAISAARFQFMNDPDAPAMLLDLLERVEVEARSTTVTVSISISRSEAADLGQIFNGDGV